MSTLATHPESLRANMIDSDSLLREELERLAAAQRELLETKPDIEIADAVDLASLRAENAELRAKLHEFDQAWGERQKEYENLLEEKSEVIRNLHLKIQELQELGGLAPATGDQEDPAQVRRQLEADRRQIREDEEALMVQMSQMEMSMSRERAELARQRTELQRLKADLEREIEKASRDGSMQERLQSLRKPYEQNTTVTDVKRSVSEATPTPKKQSSGVFRRLFG